MDETKPLVSVIVPVYKAEPYLKECLDSLAGQTLREMEIICVDDGSPDGCGAILDQYAAADPRFTVIHQTNQGVGAARGAGLKRAVAPYLTFLDPDDWVEPETYRLASDQMRADERLDLVNWGLAAFGGPGVPPSDIARMNDLFRLPRSGPWPLDGELRLHFAGSVVTSMFKTDLARRYQLGFPDFRASEDHVFLCQYLAVSRNVLFLDRPLYHYRRHPESITARWRKTPQTNRASYLEVAGAVFDFYRRHDLWLGQEEYLIGYFQKNFWLDMYDFADPKALKDKAWALAGEYRPWFGNHVFYKWLRKAPWPARLASLRSLGELKAFARLGLRFRWVPIKIRRGDSQYRSGG